VGVAMNFRAHALDTAPVRPSRPVVIS